MTIHLGIDPGFVNLGAAVLKYEDEKFTLIGSKVFCPKTLPSLELFPDWMYSWTNELPELEKGIDTAAMERYVSYQGVNTAEAENILNLIGILRYEIYGSQGILANMYRAIEWKTALSKALFKKGFRNPSTDLDKKFSIAAAAFILGVEPETIKTDHEADAICLGAVPILAGPPKTKD